MFSKWYLVCFFVRKIDTELAAMNFGKISPISRRSSRASTSTSIADIDEASLYFFHFIASHYGVSINYLVDIFAKKGASP